MEQPATRAWKSIAVESTANRHYDVLLMRTIVFVHRVLVQGGQAQLEQNKVVESRDPWIAKKTAAHSQLVLPEREFFRLPVLS